MWVKICATTTLPDAQLAVKAGADAVGFIFAPSKRRVDAEQVAQITPHLPDAVEKVGVFHAATADDIVRTVRDAGLTMVQLHFAYDAAVLADVAARLGRRVKLIQVVSCSVESLEETALKAELASALPAGNLWGILLDASTQGASGGTGMSFAWDRAASILDEIWPERPQGMGPKLILAGGLRPENVHQAMACLKPFGVDVASGVEMEPGKKDPARVQAFVQTANSFER